MREITASPRVTITLGKQGENAAVLVKFPIAGWEELYGHGSFEVMNVRPGESVPYPCTIEVDGDYVLWTVQSADVALVGHGICELTYVVSGTIAKSVIYGTCVSESIEGSGTVPAPYESRIQDLIIAATGITTEADRAKTAAEDSEAWAVGTRGGEPVPAEDETYQNNAEFYAHLAEQGASEAGFVWFDVQELTGELIVTVTVNLAEDVEFTINNETGELEVLA